MNLICRTRFASPAYMLCNSALCCRTPPPFLVPPPRPPIVLIAGCFVKNHKQCNKIRCFATNSSAYSIQSGIICHKTYPFMVRQAHHERKRELITNGKAVQRSSMRQRVYFVTGLLTGALLDMVQIYDTIFHE